MPRTDRSGIVNRGKRVTLYLSDTEYEHVTAWAEYADISVSRLARVAFLRLLGTGEPPGIEEVRQVIVERKEFDAGDFDLLGGGE